METENKTRPKCEVCKSCFKNGGPEPYLLPCLHPVCSACLNVDTTEDLACHICHETFAKNEEDTEFPYDAVRAKDILLSSVQKGSSEMLCTNRQDGQKAKSWCRECKAFLCDVCEEFHRAMKVSRLHTVMSIATFIRSGEDISTTGVCCPDHNNHPLELYDKTCSTLLCYKCLRESHSQCHIEEMDAAFESFKQSLLKEGAEALTRKLGDIEEVESNVRSLSSQLDSKIKEVRENVKQTFTDLRIALMQREEQLLLQLETCFKAVKDNNAKRLEILDQEKSRCKAVVEFSQKSLELSAPVDLLIMKKAFETRKETCVKAELPEVRKQEAHINFCQAEVQDLKEFISTFGEYYSSFPDLTSEQLPAKGRISSLMSLVGTHKERIDTLQMDLDIYAKKLAKIPRLVEKSRDSASVQFTANLQTLKEKDRVSSKTLSIRNIPWSVKALMAGDTGSPRRLNVYLFCHEISEGDWSCEVEVDLRILQFGTYIPFGNYQGQNSSYKNNPTYTCTNNTKFATLHSISVQELLDARNFYVKKDTGEVKMQVYITVKKTTGIRGLNELIKQECSLG